MGVKTPIALHEVNALFPSYDFKKISLTKEGVMDTTYILETKNCAYILKKYEREVEVKLKTEKVLLELLSASNLNTPKFLEQNDGWYLYTKLEGKIPQYIKLQQLQTLAKFMAEFHNISKGFRPSSTFLENYEIEEMLSFTKKNYFVYYKKFASLQGLHQKNEGFIHGDMFRDNTLFAKNKIAVFDFIDGGLGEFSFDLGVALLSFNPHKRASYTKIFLQSYNQKAKKKISYQKLQEQLQIAGKFYALLRLVSDDNIKRMQELVKFC